jgi:osmotically-inducible protein OsmY
MQTPTTVQRLVRAILAPTVVACTVVTGCADWRAPTRSVGLVVDDAVISDSIRSRLAATRDLDSTGIQVQTSSGEVLLSGTSRTALAKSTAEAVALKAPGVKTVRNEIAVRP